MKIYQVDAFASALFRGNPAAVCPLEEWPDDELMQNIAMENNLAETAFFVPKNDLFEIRWFTPRMEVDLCGHATLASAYVLFDILGYAGSSIDFVSPRSGSLTVSKNGDLLTLNFPTDEVEETELTEELRSCFDVRPVKALKGKTDFLLIFENEEQIRNLVPNFENIKRSGIRGMIASAPGNAVDIVSRFFAPQAGIDEDPVTGSAHTTLTPYWSEVLGKTEMTARQLSARGGELFLKYLDDRCEISGRAKLYMSGEIHV